MSGLHTLDRWIRDRGRGTPDRVAVDFLDERISYAQLDARSEALAAGLRGMGVGHGGRVAALAGNRPETVELLFACARLGATLLPLNPRLAAPELAYQIGDAEPVIVFVEPDLGELARDALAATAWPALERPLTREGLDRVAERADETRAGSGEGPSDDDPLLLVYTSGTTGKPKGALLSHANCFWTNISLDRTIDVTATDVVLQILPQCHVGGWNVQPLLAWWKGATVVLEPGFDAARVLDVIARKGVTTMMGVPSTYLFLSQQPGFADADLSSLRQAVVGGAPMPESLIRVYLDRGVSLVQGYGLTEAAPNVLGLPPEDVPRKVGFAGKPYPHVEVALRDLGGGGWVEGPATGELCVRGPNVFAGYWRNPDATSQAIDEDGWLATGDVAERDDEGFYRIRDRTKDMYVSGGENVYPAEVEAALHEHSDVVDAAVLGVPDERWGEAGLAVVVLAPGAAADAQALRAHCAERLARFKVPRDVAFADALPRNAAGKLRKGELASRHGADTG